MRGVPMKRACLAFGAMMVMAAASPALAAGCTLGRMAEMPVTMSGMRPLITVKINGKDAAFIADSGAFYSGITPGSAAELGLRLHDAPPSLRVYGIGGNVNVSVATIDKFELAGNSLPRVEFLVGGSEIGSIGFLGQNVLGLSDVEYDLPHGMIRLMRPHDCDRTNLAYWAGSKTFSVIDILPRSGGQFHTVGTVTLNGVKIRATFDTGASSSMLSLSAAARLGIKADSPGVIPADISGGIGRRTIKTWIIPIDSFVIGDEQIHHVHIRMGNLSDADTELLIGADFFISHRIYVANGQHRMFLTYEGGQVFNTSASFEDRSPGAASSKPVTLALPSGADPADAEGFSRRGAISASQHDLPHAIADFDRAIEMAPKEPRYLIERAQVHLAMQNRAAATVDLDQALTLKPDDVSALLLRAMVRGEAHDAQKALADVEPPPQAAPNAADERLGIAELYVHFDKADRAIDQYSLWIVAHPDDFKRPMALNGRCWARAGGARSRQGAQRLQRGGACTPAFGRGS